MPKDHRLLYKKLGAKLAYLLGDHASWEVTRQRALEEARARRAELVHALRTSAGGDVSRVVTTFMRGSEALRAAGASEHMEGVAGVSGVDADYSSDDDAGGDEQPDPAVSADDDGRDLASAPASDRVIELLCQLEAEIRAELEAQMRADASDEELESALAVNERVICPLCQRGMLLGQMGWIRCDSCAFLLNSRGEHSVESLGAELARLAAEHASRCASAPSFGVVQQSAQLAFLVMRCAACGMQEIVV